MSQTRELPPIGDHGPIESLLRERRSTKRFTDRSLSLADAGAALWAVAGTTVEGHRVSPSARATYPVTATLIAGNVEQLAMGAYRYEAADHAVTTAQRGDHRHTVAGATIDGADWLPTCPALVALSADLVGARERFPDQPPEHGERFVWIEVGHAAQNLYLWAAARGIGTALIAGLDDGRAWELCEPVLPPRHRLLGVLPLGEPAAPAS